MKSKIQSISLFLKGERIARVTSAQAANAVMRLCNARLKDLWSFPPTVVATLALIVSGCDVFHPATRIEIPPSPVVVAPAPPVAEPAHPVPPAPPVAQPPPTPPVVVNPKPEPEPPPVVTPPEPTTPAPVEDKPKPPIEDNPGPTKPRKPPIIPNCDRPGV